MTVTENVNFDPNIKLNGLDISEEVVTLDGDHTLNGNLISKLTFDLFIKVSIQMFLCQHNRLI